MQFIDNKYSRIYAALIEKARSENRVKGPDVYYERHHIIPRCFGGPDERENFVLLTAREHFVAHMLLCRMVDGHARHQMNCAVVRMKRTATIFSSKAYESEKLRCWKEGISTETRARMRAAKLGVKRPAGDMEKTRLAHVGARRSEETKAKISTAAKLRARKPLSESHKAAIRKGREGKPRGPLSLETKRKLSLSKAGVFRGPMTDERKAAISESKRGKPWSSSRMKACKDSFISVAERLI